MQPKRQQTTTKQTAETNVAAALVQTSKQPSKQEIEIQIRDIRQLALAAGQAVKAGILAQKDAAIQVVQIAYGMRLHHTLPHDVLCVLIGEAIDTGKASEQNGQHGTPPPIGDIFAARKPALSQNTRH